MRLLLMLMLSVVCCTLTQAQPAIHFDSSIIDLGYLPPGERLSMEIPYANTGNEPLVIRRIWGSDGGMFFGWDKQEVLPGKKGKIQVSCYTIARAGYTFRRTMQITTNAGEVKVPVIARVLQVTDSVK